MSEVKFLKVRTNQEKLTRLTGFVQHYFSKGMRLLILVPNDEVGKYLTQLFWRQPEEGFLPHAFEDKPTEDFIQLTKVANNFNRAEVLLNLCPGVAPFFTDFKHVFDIFDETHESKMALSKQRQEIYTTQGWKTSLI